ncbi:MAG: hypothetical protein ABI867_05340 [Kofleriaceae bacterium]
MSVLATRSDFVIEDEHTPPPGSGLGDLLRALDHELRVSGRLAFATCEALRHDDRSYGLEGVMSFLRCTMFATDPDAPVIPRRHRVQACRLMLISMFAHTETPRWTTFQLEQLLEAAMHVPGAELSDLVQAQFSLLVETARPTSSAQAGFIRELGAQITGKRRSGHDADDFVWIAVRLNDPVLTVTEAQAYLAIHTLPRHLRRSTRAVILRKLGDSVFADEVGKLIE